MKIVNKTAIILSYSNRRSEHWQVPVLLSVAPVFTAAFWRVEGPYRLKLILFRQIECLPQESQLLRTTRASRERENVSLSRITTDEIAILAACIKSVQGMKPAASGV